MGILQNIPLQDRGLIQLLHLFKTAAGLVAAGNHVWLLDSLQHKKLCYCFMCCIKSIYISVAWNMYIRNTDNVMGCCHIIYFGM